MWREKGWHFGDMKGLCLQSCRKIVVGMLAWGFAEQRLIRGKSSGRREKLAKANPTVVKEKEGRVCQWGH